MRPLIYGGDAVSVEILSELSRPLRIGDIIAVQINDSRILHRLVSIVKHPEKGLFYFTKGDPLKQPEIVKPQEIIGRAVFVIWRNVPFSLVKGWVGFVNWLLGKFVIGLYLLERKKYYTEKLNVDPAHYRFRGYIYTFVFSLLFPAFFLILYMTSVFVKYKNPEIVNTRIRLWQFYRAYLRMSLLSNVIPGNREIQLILNHNIAGLGSWNWENTPAWFPVIQEKKRQLLHSIRAVDQLSKLVNVCQKNGIQVIPLKALSLQFTLYRQDSSQRPFGDIDLFIPFESTAAFVKTASEIGYKVKKPKTLDPERLRQKNKFELISNESSCFSIDVHTGFIVKKLANQYAQPFLHDALKRVRKVSFNDNHFTLLDIVDEWLYLAQHFVIHHRNCGSHWLYDLYSLQRAFSQDEIRSLYKRADRYGMRSVLWTVGQAIETIWGERNLRLKIPAVESLILKIWVRESQRPEIILDQLMSKKYLNLFYHAETIMWEVIFTDRRKDRLKSIKRMFFPNYGLQKTFWGSYPRIFFWLTYPVHFFLSCLCIGLFGIDTMYRLIRLLLFDLNILRRIS